jgi:serine/threonine protein phosphatase 1
MASYIIGDIHGCLDELRHLLDQLPLQRGDRLIFLGDYIDRGPDSHGVVSFLLQLEQTAKFDVVFLKGNHEDMFLSYLGFAGQNGAVFLYNGGHTTLASYGIEAIQTPAEEIARKLPPDHLEFYAGLKPYYLFDSYLCVHAGVRPQKKLKEQTESDMLWIRGDFIRNPHRLPYTVLFGHTPQTEVFFDLPYKVGLDTGLVYGNKLSCLAAEEKVIYQIKRGSKSVMQSSVTQNWDHS